MSTVATAPISPSAVQEKFSKGPGFVGTLIFIGVLVVGIAYIGWSLSRDLVNLHVTSVQFWLARQYHSRFIFGRRGHDGGKSFWLAVGHCPQLADGLDPDPAGGHDSVRLLVLDLPQTLLARGFASHVAAQHVYPGPFGAGPLNVQPKQGFDSPALAVAIPSGCTIRLLFTRAQSSLLFRRGHNELTADYISLPARSLALRFLRRAILRS
jgi:hypothetical protein